MILSDGHGGEGSEFDRELKSVIFSNVSTDERYGRESFDELIKFKTEETYDRIYLLQKNLHQLNQQILTLENKLRKEFQRKLDQQLVLKRSELAAHIKESQRR